MALQKAFVNYYYLTVIVCLFRSVSSEVPCYFPDGTLSEDDVPCKPSDNFSVCCGRGLTCLSNKVCIINQDHQAPERITDNRLRVGVIYRASCTDMSWNSPQCPSFCKDSASQNGTYQQISSCGSQMWCCEHYSLDDGSWCCNNNKDNSKFKLDEITQDYISIPLSPENSTSSTDNRPRSSYFRKIAIGVGIGVGLGVYLTFVMTICILFFLRTRHRREIPTESIAVAQTSKLENVTVVAHREFGLPGSRSPVVELPG